MPYGSVDWRDLGGELKSAPKRESKRRNRRRRWRARLNPVGDGSSRSRAPAKCRIEAAKKLLRAAGYTVTKRRKS